MNKYIHYVKPRLLLLTLSVYYLLYEIQDMYLAYMYVVHVQTYQKKYKNIDIQIFTKYIHMHTHTSMLLLRILVV